MTWKPGDKIKYYDDCDCNQTAPIPVATDVVTQASVDNPAAELRHHLVAPSPNVTSFLRALPPVAQRVGGVARQEELRLRRR